MFVATSREKEGSDFRKFNTVPGFTQRSLAERFVGSASHVKR